MTDIRELRKVFNEVYGRKDHDGKSEEWLVREYDKAQDLLQNVRELGYDGAFVMPFIRAFIRKKDWDMNSRKQLLDIGELLITFKWALTDGKQSKSPK